ncbi:phosphatidylethanolamine-binding protein [Hoeflea olei]|uniref:Phosphatidylethanolamine-binding protein n=1 Tax=Hoeflea olei TaxID=1480615 RepID=A0A1C1Z1Q8_9HYPH|nr:phosphatidylethanolamine-binding protein [Hoeflea olei]
MRFRRSAAVLLAALATLPAAASAMELESPSFETGGTIPSRFSLNTMGCTGENISPALTWTDAPAGTKSFAVTMFDPDAPTGSGWWHWVLVNIPADVTSLGERSQPREALATNTDFGISGYLGPCPPVGAAPHRYVVTVYALDVATLELNATSPGAMAGFMINSHMLDKASITGFFGR